MGVVTWSVLYLGTLADIDTDEGDSDAENPGALIGTYGSAGAPLAANKVWMTTTSDEDDALELDHAPVNTPDTVSYDLGGGPVVTQLDTVAVVTGTITFMDGSPSLGGSFGVVQDATGALFLTISDSQVALDDAGVESFEITSVTSTTFAAASQTTRDDLEFVCFAAGTLIETPEGARAVEGLRAGDMVCTLDHGAQPIRWTGGRAYGGAALARREALLPVIVAPGALGAGLPARCLRLSRHHRVLATGPVARRMFGVPQVLIPVRHLLGLPGVALGPPQPIAYHHVLLDRHAVLSAEGAPVESLFGGQEAFRTLGAEALLHLLVQGAGAGVPARPIIDDRRARRLVERCTANGHPICAPARGRDVLTS